MPGIQLSKIQRFGRVVYPPLPVLEPTLLGCSSLTSRTDTGGYRSQCSSISLDSGYDSGHVSGYGYDSGYDSSAGHDGNMMATQYGSGYDSGMIEIGWC
jgi:hypothetical protein